jgi:hypothetical protein
MSAISILFEVTENGPPNDVDEHCLIERSAVADGIGRRPGMNAGKLTGGRGSLHSDSKNKFAL